MTTVARLLNKTLKQGGVILVDHTGQKFICGTPNKEKPIILKLLKRNLNWKLIANPDLSFPEAYMQGDIKIENATLSEFLNLIFKNIGRREITTSSYIVKIFLQDMGLWLSLFCLYF